LVDGLALGYIICIMRHPVGCGLSARAAGSDEPMLEKDDRDRAQTLPV
jgi:hypothetical protein